MSGEVKAWFLWLLLGILLVIIGFSGSLGKLVAVAFAPGLLSPKSSTANNQSQSDTATSVPGVLTFNL